MNFKIVQCAVTPGGRHPLVVYSLDIYGEHPLGHRYRMESDNSQANHYRKNNNKNKTFQTTENLGGHSNLLQGRPWKV